MGRLRDPKTGRFIRIRKPPPAELLSAEVLAQLGQGPRLVQHEWRAQDWRFEILSKTTYTVERDAPPK